MAAFGVCDAHFTILNIKHKGMLADEGATHHNFILRLDVSCYTVLVVMLSV